jgi:hypothetical protein
MKHPVWEYRVLSWGGTFSGPKDEELEAELNGLGQEGWEALAVRPHEGGSKVTIFLKRCVGGEGAPHSQGWKGW